MSTALEARLAQEMARKVAIPIAERVAQETAVPVARETATTVAEQTAQAAADAFHAANPPIPGPEGATGATGAAGVKGADGAPGTNGKDGQDGEGITWRGDWTARARYAAQDAVALGGSSYIATAETRTKPPKGPWDLMAQKGADGTSSIRYAGRGGGPGGTGGTGSALTVSDEGTPLDTAVSSLDFTGPGVTASVVGHAVTVDIASGTPVTDTFTGDGATTTFTLSQTATGTWGIAAVNGAQLLPSEFAIAGTSVVFDVAPAVAAEVAVTYVWGGGLGGGGGSSSYIDYLFEIVYTDDLAAGLELPVPLAVGDRLVNWQVLRDVIFDNTGANGVYLQYGDTQWNAPSGLDLNDQDADGDLLFDNINSAGDLGANLAPDKFGPGALVRTIQPLIVKTDGWQNDGTQGHAYLTVTKSTPIPLATVPV